MTTIKTPSSQIAALVIALSVSLHSLPSRSEVLVSAPLRSSAYACHLVNVSNEPVPLVNVEIIDASGIAADVLADTCDTSLEPANSCYVTHAPSYHDGPHYCRLHHDGADGAILASFSIRDAHELQGAAAIYLKPILPDFIHSTDSFSVRGR